VTELGDIGGHTYRIYTRLSAEAQFHVGRRLLKALAPASSQVITLLPSVLASLKKGQLPNDLNLEPAKLLAPVMEALGSMSDEDSEYIIHNCLSVVQRQSDSGPSWTVVWQPGTGYRFQDLELPALLTLTGRVIQEQFSRFFTAPPS
jgi:hypothetical protein